MKARRRKHDIKMHHLSYFIQAATSGSLVAAAEILHVSQPAVSKALADLEASLGVPLFKRRPNGIELTGYGETFLRHAIEARKIIADGIGTIEEMKYKKKGQCRVGVVAIDAVPFFHDAVMQLKTKEPNIVISIITGTSERLFPDLTIGSLDFVVGRAGDPAMMGELVHEPLFAERMALVVWPSNIHAASDRLTLAELTTTPWLVPLPSSTIRKRLNEEFAEQGVAFPTNYVEGGTAMVIGTMADCPDPIVVCPYSFVAEKIASGQLIELDVPFNPDLPPTGITYRKGVRLTDAANFFIEELREAASVHVGRSDKPHRRARAQAVP